MTLIASVFENYKKKNVFTVYPRRGLRGNVAKRKVMVYGGRWNSGI